MALPLLVSTLVNVRYLSGVEMTAGVLLMTNKKRILFVDGRYNEKARKETHRGVEVRDIGELDRTVQRFKRIRVEAADLSIARFGRWKKRFKGVQLVPCEGVVEALRRQKTNEELAAIRKACSITDRVLRAVPNWLGNDWHRALTRSQRRHVRSPHHANSMLTEQQLAWKIAEKAHELGAEELAFETIVAFGPHTSRPHHRPTNRKLHIGDVIQIDMGLKVKGYCSDCSRVFFAGGPTKEQKEVYSLLCSVVRECTAHAKAGVLTSTLDRLARQRLDEAGYGEAFVHSLGHGVGLEIHEGVNLTSRKGVRGKALRSGEVITIEPGVYLAGTWGMRVEDTVLVGRKGAERLTTIKYGE